MTHPMDQDRAKMVTRKGKGKGKGKECLSSQSESSFVVGGMMSTLNKLSTSFTKAQLLKQWNNLKKCSSTSMDDEELYNHHETLRLVEKDFHFT
jgi:hypothetical protein